MLIKKEIIVNKPIRRVFSYVLDFSLLYEWDDHVTQGQRVDLGDIKVGSKFIFIYSLAGKLQNIEYTLDVIKKNQLLELSCKASGFSAIDKITFEKLTPDKTKVYYQSQINVHSKIKNFLLSPIMERIGSRVVLRLKEVLEGGESLNPKANSLSIFNIPYRFTTKGWNHRRKQFYASYSHRKTILITGATSGLGKSAAFNLAGKGCDLLLIGRSNDKLNALKNELHSRGFEKNLSLYTCDMEDLSAVGRTCDQIIADGHKLDVLINNAGALYSKAMFINNIERTIVVDLVAPWILSCKLLNTFRPDACIINVSSGGMYGCRFDISKLQVPDEPFSGSKAYAQAKRAMDVFTIGLNNEIKSKEIRVHCMHPGWSDTPGVLNSLPGFYKLTKRWLRSPFQGAETIVWLAMHNPDPGGKFWLDRQIQPEHILSSTKGQENDYHHLRKFLDPFAKPNIDLILEPE